MAHFTVLFVHFFDAFFGYFSRAAKFHICAFYAPVFIVRPCGLIQRKGNWGKQQGSDSCRTNLANISKARCGALPAGASLSLIKFDIVPLRQLIDELERIEGEF
jgi:hypothetical protein